MPVSCLKKFSRHLVIFTHYILLRNSNAKPTYNGLKAVFVEAEAEVKAAMSLTEARQGRGRGRELEAEANQSEIDVVCVVLICTMHM